MHFSLDVLPNTRKSFKRILENTSLENLNKIPEGFNNNIIWNIGHIVVTEQLLGNKLSGVPTVVNDTLIEKYKKGTNPNAPVSQEEVDQIKELLFSTIDNTIENYKNGIYTNYTEYTVSTTGNTLKHIDDALQFILFHEGIHLGIVMSLLKVV